MDGKRACFVFGGYGWGGGEAECCVASNAGRVAAGSFCGCDFGGEFCAPETAPAKMGCFAWRACGRIDFAAADAVVFFTGAQHAATQYDVTGSTASARCGAASAASVGGAARRACRSENFHTGKTNRAILCPEGRR